MGDLDSEPEVPVTIDDADASPGAELAPEVEDTGEPFYAGEWVISTYNGASRYGVIFQLDDSDAIVKTRDNRDEYITVPVSSLAHSEAGHR